MHAGALSAPTQRHELLPLKRLLPLFHWAVPTGTGCPRSTCRGALRGGTPNYSFLLLETLNKNTNLQWWWTPRPGGRLFGSGTTKGCRGSILRQGIRTVISWTRSVPSYALTPSRQCLVRSFRPPPRDVTAVHSPPVSLSENDHYSATRNKTT